MSSMLLASTFLHSPASQHLEDAYADLYAGPHAGLKDTLRIGAALGAILTYAGLLALL